MMINLRRLLVHLIYVDDLIQEYYRLKLIQQTHQ